MCECYDLAIIEYHSEYHQGLDALMKREKIKYPLSCKEAATCSKDLHLVFNEFVSRSRKFPKEKKERYRQH